jgi:hypothetical protein
MSKLESLMDEVNELFIKSTPEIRKCIINMGCCVYSNLHVWVNLKSSYDDDALSRQRLIDLQKQLNEIVQNRDEYVQSHILNNNQEIISLKETMSELKDSYELKLENERTYYTSQIIKIENDRDAYLDLNMKPKHSEIEYLKSSLINTKDSLETAHKEELSRLQDSHCKYVDSLNDQISNLKSVCDLQKHKLMEIDNQKNMNIVRAGQIGEGYVENYISTHFHEGSITNTSKTGGQGDLHYVYRECDILIEVKNKDKITSDDVNKFTRDVGETNSFGGIFVSLRPNVNVPCHPCYEIEWVENKPIIFITSFETIPDMLYVAVKTLYNLFESNKIDSEYNIDKKHKDELKDVIECVKLFKPIIDDTMFNMNKSMESLNKLRNIVKDRLLIYYENEESRGNKLAFILKSCKSFTSSNNNKFPTYDDLSKFSGISRKDIARCGGMQIIKQEYKMLYVDN